MKMEERKRKKENGGKINEEGRREKKEGRMK